MTRNETDDVQGFECTDCAATFDDQHAYAGHLGGGCPGKGDHTAEEWLREMYHGRGLSVHKIADKAGCSHATILRWMDKHDIKRRDRLDAITVDYATYCMSAEGYERWSADGRGVYVHRLAAVAWFGWDAVVDQHVHHGTGPENSTTPWDTREENIEPMPPDEHKKLHGHVGY